MQLFQQSEGLVSLMEGESITAVHFSLLIFSIDINPGVISEV